MENISSQYCNIASQQSLLPVKIFCTDIIFRFLVHLSWTVTPLSSMENISSGRNIASGHNLQIVPWRNIASQQSLLPVKIFCPDMIFRFFYISSRRNIVLGASFPWTNMDWLVTYYALLVDNCCYRRSFFHLIFHASFLWVSFNVCYDFRPTKQTTNAPPSLMISKVRLMV